MYIICILYVYYIYIYIYIYYIHVIYKSDISNTSTMCNIYKSERELTIRVGLLHKSYEQLKF